MNFLQYKEHSLPFVVNYKVIKNSCAKLNILFKDFDPVLINNFPVLEAVLFESLKRGFIEEGQQFALVESDMDDVLSFENNLGTFISIFNDSFAKAVTPTKKN